LPTELLINKEKALRLEIIVSPFPFKKRNNATLKEDDKSMASTKLLYKGADERRRIGSQFFKSIGSMLPANEPKTPPTKS